MHIDYRRAFIFLLTVPFKDQQNVSLPARIRWIKQAMGLPENKAKIDQVMNTLVNLENNEAEFTIYKAGSGDVMTIADFHECRNNGTLSAYDGSGYYMKGRTLISDYGVFRSGIPPWATHVVWYNK